MKIIYNLLRVDSDLSDLSFGVIVYDDAFRQNDFDISIEMVNDGKLKRRRKILF